MNEATALQKTTAGAITTPAQQEQIEAIARVLQQQTPKEAIRWRQGKGGRQLAYTDHVYVTRTLNNAFGWRWSFEVDNELIQYVNDLPFEATCRGKLTVWLPGVDIPIVKMQMGCQPIEMQKDGTKPVSIGDAMKGSASDALKKCASLLGIALDLYDSDHDARQNPSGEQMRQQAEPARQTQPQAEKQEASPARQRVYKAMISLRDEWGVAEDKIKNMIAATATTPLKEMTEPELLKVAVKLEHGINLLEVEKAKAEPTFR